MTAAQQPGKHRRLIRPLESPTTPRCDDRLSSGARATSLRVCAWEPVLAGDRAGVPGGCCLQADHRDAGAGSLDDRGVSPPARAGDRRAVQRGARRCAEEAGLVEVGIIAIDGTKIRANASRGANRTYEKLVADILKEAEETDRWEDGLFGPDRGDELPEHLRTEEGRRAAFKAAKERLAAKAGRGEEPEVAQFELDTEQFTPRRGRRAWHREGRKALLAQREQDAEPIAALGPSGCWRRCTGWRKTIRSRSQANDGV